MRAVSEKQIKETLSNIISMLNTYSNRLNSLKETEEELVEKASTLETYNGAKVVGSDRMDYTLDYTKYYCDKININGVEELISNSNIVSNEVERLQTNIETFKGQLNEMNSALAIITIYLANVERALAHGTISSNKTYDKMNVMDKFNCIAKLMEKDKEFNYPYLDYTPVVREGEITIPLYASSGDFDKYNCKYLEFYNKYGKKVIAPLVKIGYNSKDKKYTFQAMTDDEIESYSNQVSVFHQSMMLENNKYGDKFKNTAINPLKQITLEYIDYDKKKVNNFSWAAYTNKSDYCTFDMKFDGQNSNTHKFMTEAYSHELGHSFDNFMTGSNSKFSTSDGFMDIYNQINEEDSNYNIIREYGHKSPSECFAECTLIYYNDPDSLKEISLAGDDASNLYEYMKNILE